MERAVWLREIHNALKFSKQTDPIDALSALHKSKYLNISKYLSLVVTKLSLLQIPSSCISAPKYQTSIAFPPNMKQQKRKKDKQQKQKANHPSIRFISIFSPKDAGVLPKTLEFYSKGMA